MTETEPVAATFFDGHSARAHPARAHLARRLGAQVMVIELPGQEPVFWPVSDLREVRDQARDEGMVLSLGQDGAARLILPHDATEQAIRAIAPDLRKRRISPRMWRTIVLWGGGAIASVLVILFVLIPALSNTLAPMIPMHREQALGQQALHQIARLLGGRDADDMTCDAPAGLAALEKMTARLTERRALDYDLDVRVFDHGMANAFAVPGGHVVLFDGLIDMADSAEEVAAVLGHEIGHVENRDPTRLALRAAGSVGILGLFFGDFAGGAAALVLVERLIAANYTQAAESAADTYAHGMLAEAGLPARPMALFFMKLRDRGGDVSGVRSHLASHPNLSGRADLARAADTIGDGGFRPVLTAAEWAALKSICD